MLLAKDSSRGNEMVRLLAVGMSACLLIGSVPAAPVPTRAGQNPPTYYPTKLGTEMNFRGEKGDGSCVITEANGSDDSKLVTTCVKDDGKLRPCEKVHVSGKGIFLIERNGLTFDPPLCVLKIPVNVGDEWVADTTIRMGDHNLERRFKHTVQEPKTIEVPAGKFEAVPVVEERVDSKNEWPVTHWYAVGMGCIKMTTPGGLNETLKSFKIGKD